MHIQRGLLFCIAVISNIAGLTQAEKNNLSVAVDIQSIAHGAAGHMQTSDALQSYKSSEVTGSQFYSSTWNNGSVITTNNLVIDNYLLMYDKVRQALFIRPRDTDLVIEAEKTQVKSFTLIIGGQTHAFVSGASYPGLPPDSYLEMLAPGAGFTLFKLTQTKFQKADYNDMLKVRNGEVGDAFVDDVTYYVYHNGAAVKMLLKEHSVRKALSNLSPRVDVYLDTHGNTEFNEQLLVSLVTALN